METPVRPPPKHSEWYYLARDVGIAVLAVALGFGGVVLYTQTWPPMVVIESSSMQHSDTESYVGVIDTGDLVLVQKAATKADIQTWVEGRNTGYQTYGDYGDVLIFHRTLGAGRLEGDPPIIHRAILYLEWNAAAGGYDVPALAGPGNVGKWSCGMGCNVSNGPYGLTGSLQLFQTSPRHDRLMSLELGSIRSASATWSPTGEPYSGYITMGDHNGGPDGGARGPLWPQGAIVGKARGEIPWFGLIKLSLPVLNKDTSCCPYWGCVSPSCYATRNSWDALVITIVAALSLPVFLDLVLAWRERRKAAKEPAERENPPLEEPQKKSAD